MENSELSSERESEIAIVTEILKNGHMLFGEKSEEVKDLDQIRLLIDRQIELYQEYKKLMEGK